MVGHPTGRETYTVVGVFAPDFVPPPEVVEDATCGLPMGLPGGPAARGLLHAGVARLRPGPPWRSWTRGPTARWTRSYGATKPAFLLGASVASYRDSVVGPVGSMLGRVMAAVVLLLLIACVNVASLLITRGSHRAHELAVRSAWAPGAAGWCASSWAKAPRRVAGGALGSGLAWAALSLFRRYAPAGLPRLAEVSLDVRGLAFASLSGWPPCSCSACCPR